MAGMSYLSHSVSRCSVFPCVSKSGRKQNEEINGGWISVEPGGTQKRMFLKTWQYRENSKFIEAGTSLLDMKISN